MIRTCDPCDPPRALDAVLTTARDVHTLKEHTHSAAHPWHAWCGRVVCVPKSLHDDWLRKGHDAAWLFAFYDRRHAAIAAGERITVNDFAFWRTALRAELETTAAPGARRRPDIPNSRPCPHQPPCPPGDTAACVDRTMAEWQPKKEQSG